MLGLGSHALLAAAALGLLACNEPGPALTGSANACSRTAERIVDFELGSASTNRIPTVNKYRTACEELKLTPAEQGCIANAHDTWTVIACAPRMFPTRGPKALADCKQVIGRTRAAVESQMPAGSGSAGGAMVSKMMDVMEKACVEDGWPEAVRTCVLQTRAGDLEALQKCNETLPSEMREKLQQRLAAEISN